MDLTCLAEEDNNNAAKKRIRKRKKATLIRQAVIRNKRRGQHGPRGKRR